MTDSESFDISEDEESEEEDEYDTSDSNESESYCSIPDNCIRTDIVFGYIHLTIEPLLSSIVVPMDIKSLISIYYRYIPYFNASIINHQQKLTLIKLLIQKELFRSSNKFTFKLLFDAKTNNFSSQKFHEACDNKSDILVIIKNTTGSIYGYYSRFPFDKNGPACAAGEDFMIFRLESDINEYSSANSMYRNMSRIDPEIISNMKIPKVFDANFIAAAPEYDDKNGPSISGCPTIRIMDKCNIKDSNQCYHMYRQNFLGVEICGTMTETAEVNCLHSWSFTVENYQVFQMENDKFNANTQAILDDIYHSSECSY
eukprot:504549_1